MSLDNLIYMTMSMDAWTIVRSNFVFFVVLCFMVFEVCSGMFSR